MSEGRPSILSFLYLVVYVVLYLLDAAGDNSRYKSNTNKYILLQFKLDILMASPPHTPPRKDLKGAS